MPSAELNHWLDYLETLHPKAIDLGLDRARQVACALNLFPFKPFVITVAGTNGKGSCVALLEAVLHAAGYTVGVYTSPHLFHYNERYRINTAQIDDVQLCAAFAAVETARQQDPLTSFEFATLAALLLFKQLDIVILEVGMGGRLDAVNIIDPDIAVITTIALDHVEWLGDTREQIGFEKAGIMRAHRPVVCGDFAPPRSISLQAQQCGAVLYCMQQDFAYQAESNHWSWWSADLRYDALPFPKIELQNAATALKVLELLTPALRVTPTALIQGLTQVCLPGRFQVLHGSTQRIFDVAHNVAAATWLATQLRLHPCQGKTRAVVAMLNDKDQKGTLAAVLPDIDNWYLAGLSVARGGPAEFLGNALTTLGVSVFDTYPSVALAYQAALAAAQPGDRVIVFGSFHTVAEAMHLGL